MCRSRWHCWVEPSPELPERISILLYGWNGFDVCRRCIPLAWSMQVAVAQAVKVGCCLPIDFGKLEQFYCRGNCIPLTRLGKHRRDFLFIGSTQTVPFRTNLHTSAKALWEINMMKFVKTSVATMVLFGAAVPAFAGVSGSIPRPQGVAGGIPRPQGVAGGIPRPQASTIEIVLSALGVSGQ